MLDMDELRYVLDNQLDKTETEAEIMMFCSTLLTYANGICTAFAEDEEAENREDTTDDTYIS